MRNYKPKEQVKSTIINAKVTREVEKDIIDMCKATNISKSQLIRMGLNSIITEWKKANKIF